MASSAVIRVDTNGLRDLAGKCKTAQAALVSDTGLFSEGGNGIEHSRLRKAINGFEENWSDKRNRIHDSLGKTATAFRAVADSFETVEEELVKKLSEQRSADVSAPDRRGTTR